MEVNFPKFLPPWERGFEHKVAAPFLNLFSSYTLFSSIKKIVHYGGYVRLSGAALQRKVPTFIANIVQSGNL